MASISSEFKIKFWLTNRMDMYIYVSEQTYFALGFNSVPSLNHFALGLGLPVYGTFTMMSSPLLTVTPSSSCGEYPTLGGPAQGKIIICVQFIKA